MNMTEQHVHHLAKRLHAAHGRIEQITAKFSGLADRFVGTLEVGGGAFLGGVVEGKTQGGAIFGAVPYNLAAGVALLAAGHFAEELVGETWAPHLNNVGNGLVAGYIASKGYAFGSRWHDTGSLKGAFGGGGAPQLPGGGPVVQGEVNGDQLQAMVNAMEHAAG